MQKPIFKQKHPPAPLPNEDVHGKGGVAHNFLHHISQYHSQKALVSKNNIKSFEELLKEIQKLSSQWQQEQPKHFVVLLKSGYSIPAIEVFFAALDAGFHLVLAPAESDFLKEDIFWDFEIEFLVNKIILISKEEKKEKPRKLRELEEKGETGLILITSGSSGRAKQVVYSFNDFMNGYLQNTNKPLVTVPAMAFDHFGGLDVWLRVLGSGGTLVIPESPQPEGVFAAAEAHQANFLSATPSFFRMALAAGVHRQHPLPHLRWINLGAETIAPTLVQRLAEVFPQAEIRQTFGTTETGVAAVGKSGDLIAKENRTRIENGNLQVKRHPAFRGYLNQEDPGEFIATGDMAEADGNTLRILGRSSRIINTGGEKVHPEAVEAVLMEYPGVMEARVYPEPHPLLGQIVCAEIVAAGDATALKSQLRNHCRERLLPQQVPVKITITEQIGISGHWKKQ